MKGSTAAGIELMKMAEITCWIETQKNEMEIGDANSINATKKQGKESSGMEPWPQHKNQNLQSQKRSEDEINDFLRPEEIDESKGNDARNNDTWIKISKEKWKTNSQ